MGEMSIWCWRIGVGHWHLLRKGLWLSSYEFVADNEWVGRDRMGLHVEIFCLMKYLYMGILI